MTAVCWKEETRNGILCSVLSFLCKNTDDQEAQYINSSKKERDPWEQR